MIKNVKPVELNISVVTVLFNMQDFNKIIQQNTNVCFVTKIIKKKFDEKLKKRFFNWLRNWNWLKTD